MKQRRTIPWYVGPYAILIIGILGAGFVFWKLLTRNHGTTTRTNTHTTLARCGNGICENVACQSTNCPTPENAQNCPQDCSTGNVDTGSTGGNADQNQNTNAMNGNTNTASDHELHAAPLAQTATQATQCPVNDMNMTTAAAVDAARNAGLTQGIRDVDVSLYQYGDPLSTCIWQVKNYATTTSGTVYIIVDSTQEVYDHYQWQS